MTNRLGRIGPEHIQAGIQPDLPGKTSTVFRAGANVVFADRSIQPALGSVALIRDTLTSSPFTGLLPTVIDGERVIIYGTAAKLYRWTEGDDAAVEVGTGYTGTNSDLWSLIRWGNWVVATNGVDPSEIYKGTSFAPMTVPWTTNQLFARATSFPYLLAFETAGGTLGGEGRMHWSHIDDIEQWDPAGVPGSRAGYLPIRDLDGPIVAAVEMGQNVAFYTHNSMFVAYLLDSTRFTFGARRLLEGIGAVGKFAVTSDGSRHYGFGPRGIWVTDGNTYEYFDVGAVRDFVFGDLDFTKIGNAVAWMNLAEHKAVEFFYPSLSAPTVKPDKGIAFNTVDRNWSPISYGYTAVGDKGVFNFAVAGNANGQIFAHAVPGLIESVSFGRLPIGDEENVMKGSYGGVPYGGFHYG